MAGSAFPIIYVEDVARAQAFYAQLGFEETYRFPDTGDSGYISMTRGPSQVGLANEQSPKDLIGVTVGQQPRFELFVYVDDVDATIERLRSTNVPVLREPEDMPWGERIAYVSDPEENPVALASR